jgi:hypothetical protein
MLHPESSMRPISLLLLFFVACVTSWNANARGTDALHGRLVAPVGHVFVIVLENEPYGITFGPHSPASYLSKTLKAKGALLPDYYSIGHMSLDNYIAMISGQAPNPQTQDDCPVMTGFVRTRPGLNADGQALGSGCVYPTDVHTVAGQLHDAGLDWRGYMEDMGNDPDRESATCGHVPIGARDHTNHASAHDQYADKHDPFVYFHAIIDHRAYCSTHVVNLRHLRVDLKTVATTPQFAYITPNLCHDGHDAPCANGKPGGLVSANAFLKTWVPRILASPAYRKNGLLVITFDEGSQAHACCHEKGLPGGRPAGIYGPGGGRIGAVLLSPFIKPGTVSTHAYNHYALLRSIEDAFDLPYLGYAGAKGLRAFGPDVFTARKHIEATQRSAQRR